MLSPATKLWELHSLSQGSCGFSDQSTIVTRKMFKCRHFAWWQTNFFVTFFFSRPDLAFLERVMISLLQAEEPAPQLVLRSLLSKRPSGREQRAPQPPWASSPSETGLLPLTLHFFCMPIPALAAQYLSPSCPGLIPTP